MTITCASCSSIETSTEGRTAVVRAGRFWRKSDGRWIQRYRCRGCGRGFSRATPHPCYRQNKRHLNQRIRELLCSGVSQRRMAIHLNVSRTTIARKFRFLAARARINLAAAPPATAEVVEFDDLETFEHSRYRPVSVVIAVESATRRILDFEMAPMKYKGRLPKWAFAKHGARPDRRNAARRLLFERLRRVLPPELTFKSDSNVYYAPTVRRYFPRATHLTFVSKRAAHIGQGELKGPGFDPLFSLNHTFAMYRANVNRLFRRTWCTTKKIAALGDHLVIYADYHNSKLI